eukprot:9458882-Alexandrium_andersonii.AAC.2
MFGRAPLWSKFASGPKSLSLKEGKVRDTHSSDPEAGGATRSAAPPASGHEALGIPDFFVDFKPRRG